MQVNGASDYCSPTASVGTGSSELGWDKLLIVFPFHSSFLWLGGSASAVVQPFAYLHSLVDFY